MLSSGADRDVICEALLRLAEAQAWAHRFDRARAHLETCGEILSRDGFDGARREELGDAAERFR
ncbi:MAG TPA: hypothetical protein VHR97_03805 [Candidatus Baltobacteraceae bacterium]|nr:hypothetical protein [Candidatus Baltobacteraceae bacterium]